MQRSHAIFSGQIPLVYFRLCGVNSVSSGVTGMSESAAAFSAVAYIKYINNSTVSYQCMLKVTDRCPLTKNKILQGNACVKSTSIQYIAV